MKLLSDVFLFFRYDLGHTLMISIFGGSINITIKQIKYYDFCKVNDNSSWKMKNLLNESEWISKVIRFKMI